MTRIFVFLVYLRIVQSSLDVAPTNGVVVAGQRMEMECRTNNGTKVVEWTLQRPSTSEKPKVFSNFDKEPNRIDPDFTHFGTDVDANGSGLIYSNSTRLTDAGIYTCKVQEGLKQPVSYSAQLIVLEKEPVCETKLTSDINLTDRDKIWFHCSVNFSGNWAPTSEWRQQCGDTAKEGHVLTDGVETVIATNSSVTSTLILANDSSRSSYNISCKIYFIINTDTSNTNATNIPQYSYVWNSTEYRLTTWESNLTNDIGLFMSGSEKGDTTVTTVQPIPPPDATFSFLIAVLIVVGLIVMIIIVCCVGCVCYKKKITEFLIHMAADLQGGSMESNREKRLSRSKIPVPRPPHAYTQMQICSAQRPTFQESPKVQLRFKEEPKANIEAGTVHNQTYSVAHDDRMASYATLSRDAQPPTSGMIYGKKVSSIYDRKAESTYAAITDSIYDTRAESTCAKATAGTCVDSIGIKATDGNCAERTCVEIACVEATNGNRAEIVGIASSSVYDKATDVYDVKSTYATTTDSTYSAIPDSVDAANTDSMYAIVRDT